MIDISRREGEMIKKKGETTWFPFIHVAKDHKKRKKKWNSQVSLCEFTMKRSLHPQCLLPFFLFFFVICNVIIFIKSINIVHFNSFILIPRYSFFFLFESSKSIFLFYEFFKIMLLICMIQNHLVILKIIHDLC